MASFRKHANNTWEYRIRYKDVFTSEYKEKSKRGFTTKKEAQLAAAEEEKKIASGFEQTTSTLGDYLNTWLSEYKKDTVRKNTFKIHEQNIKNHILPYFKNISLNDFKPVMYQKFLNHLIDSGYSKRTAEIVHGTMHNAMEKAVILGKLEKNPCIGSVVKGKKNRDAIKFIESSDISKFLQAAHQYGYIYWIFFKVLMETGMRKGEAAALQWTDIDLKEMTININKTLDFAAESSDELFGDTKTFNSNRTIRISKTLANDLRYHLNYQNQNKVNINELYNHQLNLVLCRDDGNIMPKSSLFNAFSRILKKAGLPSMPIHSLRHTHAVLLMETGVDMKYIQERLGHGSVQITSDIYAHISKKIESEGILRFEEYFNKVLE